MTSLLDGLRANRLLQLRVVMLGRNDVREQGAYACAKLLADSRTLTHLVLAGNPLGDAGVKVLCDVSGPWGMRRSAGEATCIHLRVPGWSNANLSRSSFLDLVGTRCT